MKAYLRRVESWIKAHPWRVVAAIAAALVTVFAVLCWVIYRPGVLLVLLCVWREITGDPCIF